MQCAQCTQRRTDLTKCGSYCPILTYPVHILTVHTVHFLIFFPLALFLCTALLSPSRSLARLFSLYLSLSTSISISPFSLYAFYAVAWLVFLTCIFFLQRHKCYFAFSILAIHIGGCMASIRIMYNHMLRRQYQCGTCAVCNRFSERNSLVIHD